MSFPGISLCFMHVDQDVHSQLLLQSCASLPAAILPASMIMESNAMKLLTPNKLFLL